MILLLSLFAGYLTCIFGFSHVHIIDGVRIVHSHPFQDGHEDSDHSKGELILLNDISHFVSLLPEDNHFDFTTFYQPLCEFVIPYTRQITSTFRLSHFLRGPPVL